MHEFAVVVSSIFRPYMVYYTEERDIMTHTTHRKQKAYFFQSRTGIYSGRHIYILLGRFLWFWNLAIFWKKKRCSRKNIPEIIYYGSYFCKIPEKNIPDFFVFWNLASKSTAGMKWNSEWSGTHTVKRRTTCINHIYINTHAHNRAVWQYEFHFIPNSTSFRR